MLLRVVLAVGLLSLVASCTGAPEVPAPPESRAPSTTRTPEPVAFDPKPVWSRPVASGFEDTGFTLVGDALIHIGLEDGERYLNTLWVLDAASGAVRWSIKRDTPIDTDGARLGFLSYRSEVLGAEGDWSVLVQYEKDITLPSGAPGREEGLAALSGVDGTVRWRIPVLRDRAIDSGPGTGVPWSSLQSFRADDQVAVATVTTFGPKNQPTKDTWVAFDLASRKKLWEAPWAAQDGPFDLVGDTVIGKGTRPGDAVPSMDKPGVESVVALDVRTGEERWNTTGTSVDIGGMSERGVLVDRDEGHALLVVDPDTGDELVELEVSTSDVACGTRSRSS